MSVSSFIVESNEPFYVKIKSKIIDRLKDAEKLVMDKKITVIADDLAVSYPHLCSYLRSKGYNVIICKNKCSKSLYQVARSIVTAYGIFTPQAGINTPLLVDVAKDVASEFDALILVHPVKPRKYLDFIKSLRCKTVIIVKDEKEGKKISESVFTIVYRDKIAEIVENIDEYKFLLDIGVNEFVTRKLQSILKDKNTSKIIATTLKILCDVEATNGLRTKELYNKFVEISEKKNVKPISRRTLFNYLQQLHSSKIIKMDVVSFGRYGRTSIIKINPHIKEIVKNFLRQYEKRFL